jgi:hypothetical protein
MPELLARHRTGISAGHDLFLLYDPTCDEPADLAPATRGAIQGTVGWAPSAVSVNMTPNVGRYTVVVHVWSADPGPREADLAVEGSLALPSGQVSVDMALDDESRLGRPLPPGPGTYAVRLLALHRDEVGRRRDEAFAGPEIDFAAMDALHYLEEYHFHLWQLSPEPRWPDDED